MSGIARLRLRFLASALFAALASVAIAGTAFAGGGAPPFPHCSLLPGVVGIACGPPVDGLSARIPGRGSAGGGGHCPRWSACADSGGSPCDDRRVLTIVVRTRTSARET